MAQESVLYQELEKLEINDLKKIAGLWNLAKLPGKDKKGHILGLMETFQDEFYLKGVLEKFSPLQVTILTGILKSKGVMTLGEISRKVNIPPINVEMELGVLRKYYLIYQRKNRERLTNNLDKYHTYEEIQKHIKVEVNHKGEKFQYTIEKALQKTLPSEISPDWRDALGIKKVEHTDSFAKQAIAGIPTIISKLNDFDKEVLHKIYSQGGMVEAETIRNFITVNRGKFEVIIPHLTELHIIRDIYYVEDRFIRVIVLPKEVLLHLIQNPILPPAKKGTKLRTEKLSTNGLDFFLNTKKLISYISRKGLNLAKSGKIKQADHNRTETELLSPDIELFPDKSRSYQIELILPILKLLNYVDIKGENVVLVGDTDGFLKKDIFEIMKLVIHEVNEARTRRLNPPEVFSATGVPFYEKGILDKTVKLILHHHHVNLSVIFSQIIREHLIFTPTFQIKTYEEDLAILRKEIVSALFYLQLFGLIDVEYPHRNINISELGKHFFHHDPLVTRTEKGGITINPDFSIIAFPDRVSLHGIHLLKAFCELKDYDRVYTFILTKDSFQMGILLGYEKETFIHFLKDSSKAELAQNLLFLLDDWGNNLPMVTITEDSVLVRTKDPQVMELLLGQIKGKKYVLEEISPTGIAIDKSKVQEVITMAEKLNMIIRLNR